MINCYKTEEEFAIHLKKNRGTTMETSRFARYHYDSFGS